LNGGGIQLCLPRFRGYWFNGPVELYPNFLMGVAESIQSICATKKAR
jgi:hypothetical protein